MEKLQRADASLSLLMASHAPSLPPEPIQQEKSPRAPRCTTSPKAELQHQREDHAPLLSGVEGIFFRLLRRGHRANSDLTGNCETRFHIQVLRCCARANAFHQSSHPAALEIQAITGVFLPESGF